MSHCTLNVYMICNFAYASADATFTLVIACSTEWVAFQVPVYPICPGKESTKKVLFICPRLDRARFLKNF